MTFTTISPSRAGHGFQPIHFPIVPGSLAASLKKKKKKNSFAPRSVIRHHMECIAWHCPSVSLDWCRRLTSHHLAAQR